MIARQQLQHPRPPGGEDSGPLTGRPGVRPLHRVQESGPSTGSPGVRPRPLHRESRAQVPPQGDQDSGPSTGSPAPARGKKSGLGRVQPVVRGCWEWACGCAHSSSGQWGANEGLSRGSDVIRHFPGRVTCQCMGEEEHGLAVGCSGPVQLPWVTRARKKRVGVGLLRGAWPWRCGGGLAVRGEDCEGSTRSHTHAHM